ncbi:Olfactory Receptor 5B2 [Manis pentadactyla]|nr:Olfactory Receptor 5B2 [Manis pentadactyla]
MLPLLHLVTLAGNLGMILLILRDSRLHTPMSLFLGDLSLGDFGSSSAVTPTVMAGLLTGDKVLPYRACAAQMSFYVVFATVGSYLLASVTYDHCAAVCKPLHYPTTMTTGCYICGFLNASIHVGGTFHLSFCVTNVVHHFFCDVPAVMALSCSNRHVTELVLFYVASFNTLLAVLVIIVSYILIFINILKMHLSAGYQKALTTCASHSIAVSIFYGTIIFMYLQPSSRHSMDTDKVASVFYAMIIPMLNPVVYSLRNKEVKSAFRKVVLDGKLSLGL